MTTSKSIKPPRRLFRGHRMVRHGPSDWRCACGHPLRYWKFQGGKRIDLNGYDGAQEAMKLHRAYLWLSWNAA